MDREGEIQGLCRRTSIRPFKRTRQKRFSWERMSIHFSETLVLGIRSTFLDLRSDLSFTVMTQGSSKVPWSGLRASHSTWIHTVLESQERYLQYHFSNLTGGASWSLQFNVNNIIHYRVEISRILRSAKTRYTYRGWRSFHGSWIIKG